MCENLACNFLVQSMESMSCAQVQLVAIGDPRTLTGKKTFVIVFQRADLPLGSHLPISIY